MRFNRCLSCMKEISQGSCPHCGFDPQTYQAESFEIPLGSVIYGRYVIGRRLGQGGFGITYVGWDMVLACKVAVKEYFPSGQVTRHPSAGLRLLWNNGEQAESLRAEGMDSFLKEARKMVKVDGITPIVRVLNTFQENDTAYIVMEFVEGENLKDILDRDGPMTWKQAKPMFLPVIQTMKSMHESGIIHRDISPDNLMLQPDGTLRILDLGAAKDISANTGKSSMVVTKEGYSPIEQYTQSGATGTWTDVYAMAATIYYTLTGKVPPTAVERIETDTLDWKHPRLAELAPNELAAMQKAMVVIAAQRTENMGAFLDNLTNNKFQNSTQGSGKKTWLWAAAAAVVLVLLGAGGYAFSMGMLSGTPGASASVSMTTPTEAEKLPEAVIALSEEPAAPVEGTVLLDLNFAAKALDGGVEKSAVRTVSFVPFFPEHPEEAWDASAAGDKSILAWMEDDGTTLKVGSTGEIQFPASCRDLFRDYTGLEAVRFETEYLTDSVTDMSGMFAGCTSLRELDLKGFRTEAVEDMSEMFLDCKALTRLDVSGFDTASVQRLDHMFAGCGAQDTADIWGFTVGQTKSHEGFMDADKKPMGRSWQNLFEKGMMLRNDIGSDSVFGSTYRRSEIAAVTFLDSLEGMPNTAWDASAGADGSIMAWVEKIDYTRKGLYIAAEGGVRAPEDCTDLFANYTALEEFKPTAAFDTSNTVNMSGMFRECSSLKKVDLNSLNTSNVRNMHEMFYFCDKLLSNATEKGVAIDAMDTSKVRDMSGMFSNVRSPYLHILDLSGWDTSNVTDMSQMFYNTFYIQELTISNFNTSSVTNMEKMFMNCGVNRPLDMSSFDTSNVTSMSCMFFGINQSSMDLRNFNTAKVTNMSDMFCNCASLQMLDVTSFDTSNVTDMRGMFMNCGRLVKLDLSRFNTAKVTDMSKMFYGCSALYSVDPSRFNRSSVQAWEDFMDENRLVNGRSWRTLFR